MVVLLAQSQIGSGALMACAPSDESGGSGVVQANAKKSANSIPRNYLRLYQKTGRERNIPWNVLAGIGKIETNHGQSTLPGVHNGENYAGAGGPMQFLAASWNAYGDDWNLYWKKKGSAKKDDDGDGRKDRYNPADAILGATNHLRGSIGKMDSSIKLSSTDIRNAVHRYNPGNYTPQSNPYARDVLAAANSYADGVEAGSANYAGTGTCTGAMALGAGSFGQDIAYAAAFYAEKKPGTPPMPQARYPKLPVQYAWGGGTINGPSRGSGTSPGGHNGANYFGFDCSSLAMHAVFKASQGKITMPRTTYMMWGSSKVAKVSRNQLAPGDLVFFSGKTHMAVYYGEVKGVRWMVEAPSTGDNVKFSKFDGRGGYVGAIRVKPPAGMDKKSPSVFPA
jgi:hypothetical protein